MKTNVLLTKLHYLISRL